MDRKYPSDCGKTDTSGKIFAGKTKNTVLFTGLYKKTWNFACTCRNDGTHGIMLGKKKRFFRQMTFVHVLSW